MRRQEDGERERYAEEHMQERTRGEQLRGDGGPADLKKTKGQGRELLCDTGMPVRNGNLSNDRTTTTKAAGVRKQLSTKNSKNNEGRQAKNGGVKGRDGSAEELDRETGEEQITVGRTCRKDDRLPKRAAELREQGRRRRGRPRLRWEDCVTRDARKAGEGEDGKKTRDKGGWKRISDEVVKKLRAAPHP